MLWYTVTISYIVVIVWLGQWCECIQMWITKTLCLFGWWWVRHLHTLCILPCTISHLLPSYRSQDIILRLFVSVCRFWTFQTFCVFIILRIWQFGTLYFIILWNLSAAQGQSLQKVFRQSRLRNPHIIRLQIKYFSSDMVQIQWKDGWLCK